MLPLNIRDFIDIFFLLTLALPNSPEDFTRNFCINPKLCPKFLWTLHQCIREEIDAQKRSGRIPSRNPNKNPVFPWFRIKKKYILRVSPNLSYEMSLPWVEAFKMEFSEIYASI